MGEQAPDGHTSPLCCVAAPTRYPGPAAGPLVPFHLFVRGRDVRHRDRRALATAEPATTLRRAVTDREQGGRLNIERVLAEIPSDNDIPFHSIYTATDVRKAHIALNK